MNQRMMPIPAKGQFAGFYLLLLFLLPACQRPAPPPMPEPIPPQEVRKPEAPVIDLPAEISKLPEPTPPKPTVPRVFPESVIAVPDQDRASHRVAYDTLLTARALESRQSAGWQYRRTNQGKIVGFEFSNHGGNAILRPRRDAAKNQFFTRDFQFRFDDRARQDIHFLIADWVASHDRQFRLSELMNTLVHFFPRLTLPAIRNVGERNIVTLPTGEEVEFDAATHEIRGGVLVEAPVDLNPDRSRRKFPGLEYKGKGVIVRADARGVDPRIKTMAVIANGATSSNCAAGTPCARCEVPARDLWERSGAMRFKFATDADFDRFLRARCGFGLPQISGRSEIAGSSR
jgi:hypothetical protein